MNYLYNSSELIPLDDPSTWITVVPLALRVRDVKLRQIPGSRERSWTFKIEGEDRTYVTYYGWTLVEETEENWEFLNELSYISGQIKTLKAKSMSIRRHVRTIGSPARDAGADTNTRKEGQ